MSDKESYRIDELAERWDVSDKTVRREIERGELKSFKVGKTIRVRDQEVEKYEKKRD